MEDKEFDRLLSIRTAGTLDGLNQSVHYNRYEATPYTALKELFTIHELKPVDRLVDFGCGKGRVPFYVNSRFGISATGIEMKGHLYQEALENQASYMSKSKKRKGDVRFERCFAEQYRIAPEETVFYFFNPFSIQIFMKVIDNILRSVESHQRAVELILYYPTADYVRFLETSTPFELIHEVKIPGFYEQDDNERFLVYRKPA